MTNHREILDAYVVLSITTTCAIIGGDSGPVSDDTVYRLVRSGALDKMGKGKISAASIKRYLELGQPAERKPAPAAKVSSSKAPAAAPAPAQTPLKPRFPVARPSKQR